MPALHTAVCGHPRFVSHVTRNGSVWPGSNISINTIPFCVNTARNGTGKTIVTRLGGIVPSAGTVLGTLGIVAIHFGVAVHGDILLRHDAAHRGSPTGGLHHDRTLDLGPANWFFYVA